jgi:hypothetical protein
MPETTAPPRESGGARSTENERMHSNLSMVESLVKQRALLAEVERARLTALLPPQPPREPRLLAPIRSLAALRKLRFGIRPIAKPLPTTHSATFEPSS